MQLINFLQLALLVTPYAIASPPVPPQFHNPNPQVGAGPKAPNPTHQSSAPVESLSPNPQPGDSPVSPPEPPNPTVEAAPPSAPIESSPHPQVGDSPPPSSEALPPIS